MSYKNYNISKADTYLNQFEMSNKFSETEKWCLLSNKDQIMLYRQCNIEKSDNLSKEKLLMLINETKKAIQN